MSEEREAVGVGVSVSTDDSADDLAGGVERDGDGAASGPEDLEPRSVSSSLRNSRWSLMTRVYVAAAMLLNLGVLTTQLGAADFGRYAGVAALAAILAGLTRFGASERMLEMIRDHDSGGGDFAGHAAGWGRAIGSSAVAQLVCLGVIVLLQPILLPGLPVVFVVTLAAGEFIYTTSFDIHQRLLNSLGQFRRAAVSIMGSMTFRVLAVGSIIVFPISDLSDLGLRYLASGVAALVWGATLTSPWHRWAKPTLPKSTREVRQGLSIAVGQTSLTVSTRIDQTLLLRAGFVSDTGIYSLGARAVFNAMLPANALLEVTYPDFFKAGAQGGVRVRTLAKQLAKPLLGYGVFAAVVLIALGPLVEAVLDESFTGVGWVIIVMSGFPILRISQNLVGDMLTGLGEHTARSRAAVGASVLNVGLNLMLIPSMGWQGAAVSTYAAEGFLLLALIAAVHHYEDPALVE